MGAAAVGALEVGELDERDRRVGRSLGDRVGRDGDLVPRRLQETLNSMVFFSSSLNWALRSLTLCSMSILSSPARISSNERPPARSLLTS